MTESEWRKLDLFAPTPEHHLLAQTLAEFVAREVEPQAAEHDRSETFNHALFKRAGELGLLGVTIAEEHGGAGLDATAAVQVFEALSTSDPGFALAVLAHAILFAQNVNVNASEVLKKHILPHAVSGEWIGGLCMTEPEVGTDVLAMRTRARREGDAYVLEGVKTFITNGGIDEQTLGDAFVVYAATGEQSISAFLVEKGGKGFRLGQKWKVLSHYKNPQQRRFTKYMAMSGNGQVRLTWPIQVTNRFKEPWENTTVNLCATRWSCVEGHVLPQRHTFGHHIGTFLFHSHVGSLAEFDWRMKDDEISKGQYKISRIRVA